MNTPSCVFLQTPRFPSGNMPPRNLLYPVAVMRRYSNAITSVSEMAEWSWLWAKRSTISDYEPSGIDQYRPFLLHIWRYSQLLNQSTHITATIPTWEGFCSFDAQAIFTSYSALWSLASKAHAATAVESRWLETTRFLNDVIFRLETPKPNTKNQIRSCRKVSSTSPAEIRLPGTIDIR